jgi:hypothetical protein
LSVLLEKDVKTAREGGVSTACILAVDACKNMINFVVLCAFSDSGWQDGIEILDVLNEFRDSRDCIRIRKTRQAV